MNQGTQPSHQTLCLFSTQALPAQAAMFLSHLKYVPCLACLLPWARVACHRAGGLAASCRHQSCHRICQQQTPEAVNTF